MYIYIYLLLKSPWLVDSGFQSDLQSLSDRMRQIALEQSKTSAIVPDQSSQGNFFCPYQFSSF